MSRSVYGDLVGDWNVYCNLTKTLAAHAGSQNNKSQTEDMFTALTLTMMFQARVPSTLPPPHSSHFRCDDAVINLTH